MKTEEELRAEYRRQRQELEEQAEDIHRFQQKGEEISQQTYEAILYQIRQKEEDCTDILAMAEGKSNSWKRIIRRIYRRKSGK